MSQMEGAVAARRRYQRPNQCEMIVIDPPTDMTVSAPDDDGATKSAMTPPMVEPTISIAAASQRSPARGFAVFPRAREHPDRTEPFAERPHHQQQPTACEAARLAHAVHQDCS